MALLYQELTDEGKVMFDNLMNYDKVQAGIPIIPPPKKPKAIKISYFEMDSRFLRSEIINLVANSEKVVADCDRLMEKYTTKEEYFASEAKVAKFIHKNFIDRMNRVLKCLPAFEDEPATNGKDKG